MSDKEQKVVEPKKVEETTKQKKEKKDYKKKYEELKSQNKKSQDEIKNLVDQVNTLKIENQVNVMAFQEKAKTFQTDAQDKINKFKEELSSKQEADQGEYKKFATQKLFESIIQPLINIEIAIRAGKSQGDQVGAYVAGFEMLMNQLFTELESFGLLKIVPSIGQEFEPEFHQAFSTEDGETNKILSVKKNGFKLNDRVIQPAIVVIGK